jgi:hypothetical protein
MPRPCCPRPCRTHPTVGRIPLSSPPCLCDEALSALLRLPPIKGTHRSSSHVQSSTTSAIEAATVSFPPSRSLPVPPDTPSVSPRSASSYSPAPCAGLASYTPERAVPRPHSRRADGGHLRHLLRPNQPRNGTLGEPTPLPALFRPSRAFPSPESSSLHQPWCQGPNCNLSFRPEGLSAKSEDRFIKLYLLDLC